MKSRKMEIDNLRALVQLLIIWTRFKDYKSSRGPQAKIRESTDKGDFEIKGRIIYGTEIFEYFV